MRSHNVLPVTVVIPCASGIISSFKVLNALYSANFWPAEIFIVDSALMNIENYDLLFPACFSFHPEFCRIVQVLNPAVKLLPGAARNFAISHSTQPYIAFLDIATIPPFLWLEHAYSQILVNSCELVLGSTRYVGDRWLQRLFIRATYGDTPLPTVPGSLLHRRVLINVGGFLPAIRAGEDTDWLVRAFQFGYLPSRCRAHSLVYRSVPESLIALVRKWFRNYRSCAPVVFHLEIQKTIYVLSANALFLLVAFRWNALVAGWQESNVLYVADVSKKALIVLLFLYFIVRGFLMPWRRGSSIRSLLPLYWVAIGCICIILDFTKLLAFVLPPWRNRSLVKA